MQFDSAKEWLIRISTPHAAMSAHHKRSFLKPLPPAALPPAALTLAALTLATLTLCVATTGCLGNLSQHSKALSTATAPVVDQAAKAYDEANQVHDLRVDYDAAAAFDNTAVVYNPRKIEPLLTATDIDVRLTVLKAFQVYVKRLVAITAGTNSTELDKASTALGSGLTSIANTLIPGASTKQTVIVVGQDGSTSTSTASAAGNAVSSTTQNQISVAANALGQFLISRKVKKELPAQIQKMDPYLQTLCGLLTTDVDVLKSREKIDFDYMIDQQTLFLRENKTADAGVRRQLMMQLPEIVRRERLADEQLNQLKAAVNNLASTHHALAIEAVGNNPESIQKKLAELAAAGENLGKFYSSL